MRHVVLPQVLMKMTLPEPSPLPIDPATIKTELWGPGRTKFTMEPMVRGINKKLTDRMISRSTDSGHQCAAIADCDALAHGRQRGCQHASCFPKTRTGLTTTTNLRKVKMGDQNLYE